MRSLRIAASLFILFSLPFAASAVDLSGQSRTYLQSRQGSDGTRYLPLYEYLSFRTESPGANAVSFNFGGWYRYDLQNDAFGTKSTGDLQYAYVTVKKNTGNAAASFGRLWVNEGIAAAQIDGAYARTDLRGGFTIAAFGGIPVETDGDTRSGDSAYGGRVSQGLPGIYTLGASYLQEKNNSKDFRKEEGLDLWIRPFSKLDIMGTSAYNAESKNWMQHQYHATIGPFAWLRLNLDASKTWYKEYFASVNSTQSMLMSAFMFTTPSRTGLDPNEIVTMTGGSIVLTAGGPFSVVADYRNYDYQVQNGSATYSGGSIAYAGTSFSAGAGLHRMNGPTADLRYDEQRIYLNKNISKLDLTLDFLHVAYDEAIMGEKDAYTAIAAAGYNFTPKARVVADVEYARNPDFNSDVRGMLTFVYNFDAKLVGTTKAAQPAGTAKPGTKKP
jgi:hypothetical protein